MRVQGKAVKLFFDVEGTKLRRVDARMREVPTLLLLHGGSNFDHSEFKVGFSRLLTPRKSITSIIAAIGAMIWEPAMAGTWRPGRIIYEHSAPKGERSYSMFERLGGRAARAAAAEFWTSPGKNTARK
ncbi:MAG: hypothetical protein JO166_06415 [Deltaproteobacteria bacterium]|nr:hypothetical protein [Deltaproteobacteria bacterium]